MRCRFSVGALPPSLLSEPTLSIISVTATRSIMARQPLTFKCVCTLPSFKRTLLPYYQAPLRSGTLRAWIRVAARCHPSVTWLCRSYRRDDFISVRFAFVLSHSLFPSDRYSFKNSKHLTARYSSGKLFPCQCSHLWHEWQPGRQ